MGEGGQGFKLIQGRGPHRNLDSLQKEEEKESEEEEKTLGKKEEEEEMRGKPGSPSFPAPPSGPSTDRRVGLNCILSRLTSGFI